MADSMTKLFCQTGNHHWERPSQRGRPPFNCPEHPAPFEIKERARPRSGFAGITAADAKGPRAKALPVSEPAKRSPEPEEVTKPRKLSDSHLQALIRGRQEAAERKAREEREKALKDMREEAKDIDARIQTAESRYKKAFNAAVKTTANEDIDKAFNVADQHQNSLINLLARKQVLQERL